MSLEITYYSCELEKTEVCKSKMTGQTYTTLTLNKNFEFEYTESIYIIESILKSHGVDIFTDEQLDKIKEHINLKEKE